MKTLIFLIGFVCLTLSAIPGETPQGVVIHDQARVDDCYRLFSSRYTTAAHLLRPDGRYIHSWYYPPEEQATVEFGGFGMTWHYAEMLPNGNLVAIIKDEMIIELDWHSKLVWKARLRAHHDFARTADGHTIVVSRQSVDHPWEAGSTIAMDELVEFAENGTVVWTWSYLDHLEEISRLIEKPLPDVSSFRDWPHINTCEILPDSPLAEKDSRFRAGNLLLCGRHANAIFIVDRDSGDIVWAWGPGELLGPHMPTLLDYGHILIYDNGHHLAETARGYSRVLELDPLSGDIVRQYQAKPKESFYSPSRGSANRLDNGNTLIAESDSGHLLEVTAEGEIVWEYWNSDYNDNGRRMPLYRVVPVTKSRVDSLLTVHGVIEDVDPDYEETLEFRKLGPTEQYKQFIREVVFYAELGYYDHAFTFLQEFSTVFPGDPEGYWATSLVYAAKKNVGQSLDYMRKALDAGLPASRFTAGLPPLFDALSRNAEFQAKMNTVASHLVHGPILGDITDSSVLVWMRTRGEQSVQIATRPEGALDFTLYSKKIKTDSSRECTAFVRLAGLKSSTHYEYQVIVNDLPVTPVHPFTTAPIDGESTKFTLGFGGGAGYTPHHEYMWDTLNANDLDLFLLLGDNVYIDHPKRPATQKYCYYRRQSRPEFRRFASRTPLYAIWDDHDFTYNDGKGSPSVDDPPWKPDVWQVFKHQWPNPCYGGGESQPGCWFDFSYGDVDFFMLDCRYYREVPDNNPGASMLGKAQKQWLLNKLKFSRATFKVIASSVPWAQGTKPGSLDTWDGHPEEREELFSFIEKEKIDGVVLISADRHRSDTWRIERPGGFRFYEFESSKLTNIHTHRIMPGALFGYNKTCSAGLLDFDTTLDDPTVSFRILSIDNQVVHKLTLYKSDLSFD